MVAGVQHPPPEHPYPLSLQSAEEGTGFEPMPPTSPSFGLF
jgi:hypothetical protein